VPSDPGLKDDLPWMAEVDIGGPERALLEVPKARVGKSTEPFNYRNVGFEDAAKSSQVVLDIARSSISTFREHDFAAQIHICHVAVLLRRCRRS